MDVLQDAFPVGRHLEPEIRAHLLAPEGRQVGDLEIDEDGFIQEPDKWNEGVAKDLAKTEGMLFKWGSGSGTNLSSIRSSKEPLSGGGTASGPVSFMRGYDAFAGVIKSGGKTRRAAKMVILDIDHPDIEEFILCKSEEEKKARALIDSGYYDASEFTGLP